MSQLHMDEQVAAWTGKQEAHLLFNQNWKHTGHPPFNFLISFIMTMLVTLKIRSHTWRHYGITKGFTQSRQRHDVNMASPRDLHNLVRDMTSFRYHQGIYTVSWKHQKHWALEVVWITTIKYSENWCINIALTWVDSPWSTDKQSIQNVTMAV